MGRRRERGGSWSMQLYKVRRRERGGSWNMQLKVKQGEGIMQLLKVRGESWNPS